MKIVPMFDCMGNGKYINKTLVMIKMLMIFYLTFFLDYTEFDIRNPLAELN